MLNITEAELTEDTILPEGLEVTITASNLTTIVSIGEVDTSKGQGFATLTLLADGPKAELLKTENITEVTGTV